MEKNKLLKIIEICFQIDNIAYNAYTKIANNTKNKKYKNFWENMANDEISHLKYWKDLLNNYNKTQDYPNPFKNSEKIIKELKNIIKKSDEILKNNDLQSANKNFLLAYRLEFFLLHPAFEIIFHLFNPYSQINPDKNYKNHINRFIKILKTTGDITPEFELLGETLNRLWNENKKLAIEVSTDSLTEIYNRKGFFSIAIQLGYLSKRQQNEVAILMIDIDLFKNINDTYGHQVGDSVLYNTVKIIKSCLRSADIIGRYGGEEFIIYIPDTKISGVKNIAERIRTKIMKKKFDKINITVSIGISYGIFKGEVSNDLNKFIKIADDNLLKAKKLGRNRVIY